MAQRKMGLGDVNTAGIMLLRHPLVSMFKNLCFGLLSVLTVVALPTRARAQTTPPGYFQTTFQSESQFIVEAVVSDLAEQVYFAAKGRLPESKDFSVAATERSGSPVDAPIYDLQINLDREHRLKLEVPGNSPIWSPGVYHDVAAALAKTMGLRAATAAGEAIEQALGGGDDKVSVADAVMDRATAAKLLTVVLQMLDPEHVEDLLDADGRLQFLEVNKCRHGG